MIFFLVFWSKKYEEKVLVFEKDMTKFYFLKYQKSVHPFEHKYSTILNEAAVIIYGIYLLVILHQSRRIRCEISRSS